MEGQVEGEEVEGQVEGEEVEEVGKEVLVFVV